MPVLALNSGRIWPKRPESCVEVVEATTIDLSSARAGPPSRMAATAMRQRRLSMTVPRGWRSDEQVAGDECPRLGSSRRGEEGGGGAGLDHPAARQHDDLARQPPRLAEIMGRHHDLDAARDDGADDVLERLGCRRIEARRRLVEKQHGGIARQRAGQGKALPLAAP